MVQDRSKIKKFNSGNLLHFSSKTLLTSTHQFPKTLKMCVCVNNKFVGCFVWLSDIIYFEG